MNSSFDLADKADALVAQGKYHEALTLYRKAIASYKLDDDPEVEGHWPSYWEAKADLLETILYGETRVAPSPAAEQLASQAPRVH